KDIRYAVSFIDENDQELERYAGDDPLNPGIIATEGIDVQKIRVPSQGQYRIDILVYGTGLDYNTKYAGIGSGIIEIGPSLPKTTPSTPEVQPPTAIPSWIKFTTGVWVDGNSSDDEFVNAIKFLIEEKIIVIPPTEQGSDESSAAIPSWIKFTTGVWVDGNSSDAEFISAIQFLITEGILTISS
ncbi:MAG: peptidase, partial [Nitrosopumilaceae archaeon]